MACSGWHNHYGQLYDYNVAKYKCQPMHAMSVFQFRSILNIKLTSKKIILNQQIKNGTRQTRLGLLQNINTFCQTNQVNQQCRPDRCVMMTSLNAMQNLAETESTASSCIWWIYEKYTPWSEIGRDGYRGIILALIMGLRQLDFK